MTMNEFRNQLARMRHIDRADLPPGQSWDEDWPSFRDNPHRYFLICGDQHRMDIWSAMKRDSERPLAEHKMRLIATLNEILG